jgi:hypothetical protein
MTKELKYKVGDLFYEMYSVSKIIAINDTDYIMKIIVSEPPAHLPGFVCEMSHDFTDRYPCGIYRDEWKRKD